MCNRNSRPLVRPLRRTDRLSSFPAAQVHTRLSSSPLKYLDLWLVHTGRCSPLDTTGRLESRTLTSIVHEKNTIRQFESRISIPALLLLSPRLPDPPPGLRLDSRRRRFPRPAAL